MKEAHDKGDVPKSQEVSTWFTLAGATLMIAMLRAGGGRIARRPDEGVYLEHAHQIPVDGYRAESAVARYRPVGRPDRRDCRFWLLLVMAVAGNLMQHQPLFTGETIKPKLSKISPAVRASSACFPSESLVNFAKGMLKISRLSARHGCGDVAAPG